jgi:hypothetical protein
MPIKPRLNAAFLRENVLACPAMSGGYYQTSNLGVGGSNPSERANFFSGLAGISDGDQNGRVRGMSAITMELRPGEGGRRK